MSRYSLFAAVFVLTVWSASFAQTSTFVRINQVGYLAPNEFADFQTVEIVYHDDVGDYSTNEPTMDGTADAILMMALWSGPVDRRRPANGQRAAFKYHEGAIVRGDRTTKKLALVFTGDEFGDGAETIASALKDRHVRSSFFLTGRFYKNPEFKAAVQRLKRDGHYLGAHSNEHLLYCDWDDRNRLLVSRQQFEEDLRKNYEAMREFGIEKREAPYFLPPFEWYNQTISDWTRALNLHLINFTPGTRSHADYTTPEMKHYVDSRAILESIKKYEATDPDGLNGFILLFHIGTEPKRPDRFYSYLSELIDWLRSRNYELLRIDQLLK